MKEKKRKGPRIASEAILVSPLFSSSLGMGGKEERKKEKKWRKKGKERCSPVRPRLNPNLFYVRSKEEGKERGGEEKKEGKEIGSRKTPARAGKREKEPKALGVRPRKKIQFG